MSAAVHRGETYEGRGCSLVLLILICIMALTVVTDIQFPIAGFYVSPAEIALYSALAITTVSPSSPVYTRDSAIYLLTLLFAAASIVAMAMSDNLRATISSTRSLASLFFGLMLFDRIILSRKQLAVVLSWFLVGATISSVWGIAQSALGFTVAPTIFEMHLAPSQDRADLINVIDWKYAHLSNVRLGSWQKALALGFSSFSNNLGAALTFATCVSLYFYAARPRLRSLMAALTFLFLLATLLSAARIPLIFSCFCLIPLYLMLPSSSKGKSGLTRLVAFYIVLGALLLLLSSGLLLFDKFGTVRGRFGLNEGGFEIWLSDWSSTLWGGKVGEYYQKYVQSPHAMIIYLLLQFGILGAAPVILVLFRTVRSAVRWNSTFSRAAQAGYPPGYLSYAAIVWFLGYGLTWSAVEISGTNLSFVILASAPLAYMKGLGLAYHSTPAVEQVRNMGHGPSRIQPRVSG